MAINAINNCKIKDDGKTNEIVCPVCGKQTEIRLFENFNDIVLATLLDKKTTENYAVCPLCASVFSVGENFIAERKRGTTCFLTASDLTVIKKAKKDE